MYPPKSISILFSILLFLLFFVYIRNLGEEKETRNRFKENYSIMETCNRRILHNNLFLVPSVSPLSSTSLGDGGTLGEERPPGPHYMLLERSDLA